MIIEKQQSANGTVVKDSVTQLLQSGMLEQGNLGSKVDYEETDKLINSITNISKDDIVGSYHVHRSKRNIFTQLAKILHKIPAGKKLSNQCSKLWSHIQHAWNKRNTKKNRKAVKDIVEGIVDYLDDYEDNLYNKTLQESTTQISAGEQREGIREILEMLSGLSPEVVAELSRIGEEQVTTAIPQVTVGQNITTVIPQATEGRNVTTEMPQVTGRDCVQEILKAIPDISPESKAKLSEILNRLFEEVKKQEEQQGAEWQNITTSMPQVTVEPNITTEMPQVTEGLNITTKMPRVTEGHNITAKKQQITVGPNIATEMPRVTEGQHRDFVQEILEFISDLSGTGEEQVTTATLQVIEGQNITTEMPQITEGHNITTAVPQVTERQQVTTEMPRVTEGQNITTEMPHITVRPNVTTEIPQVTVRQNITTETPRVTERQNTTIEVPQIREVSDNKTLQETTTQSSQTSTVMPLEQLNLELIKAVKQSNLDKVEEYINKGADVNTRDDDWDNSTILHLAIKKGFVNIARFLLDKCANVSVQNVLGDTPLHLAAEKGHLDIVGYLTEKGANVNVKRRYGLTPLHFAAQSGHLDIVKYLVDEKGADINVRDGHGKAPVYFAVCNGHLDIIKYLVDIKGAYFGTNYSLYVAVQNGYLDIVKYLVDEKGADFNVMEGYYSDTPLHFAAKNGHLDVVKYLVDEKGANVNAENTSWYTPLHMAAWGGYLNVVKYLVEKGADINAKDKGNRTPLDLTNTRDVIKYLQGLNTHRSRRDVFHDSWTSNSIVNWVKGLLPSTELPALLTSKTYNNSTTTIAPEVNATVVNNTIILGILTAGLFNKTQHKQSIHENLLSPREQLISNVDNASRFLEASLRKGEEEGWGIPSTDVDEVEISGNKTEVWKGNK